MYIRLTGKILVEISDNLYEFNLPEPLYSMYMDLITSIEANSLGACVGDLARRDLHDRLTEWWTGKMPHVEADKFNAALRRTVEHDLPYYRKGQ